MKKSLNEITSNNVRNIITNRGNKNLHVFFYLLIIAIMVAFVTESCHDHSDEPVISGIKEDQDASCGVVDTVKSAITGEVSAHISAQQPDVNYFIALLISGSTKRYQGISNQGSAYVFFPGLPSGTYTCYWIVSGCKDTEVEIPGPGTVTIR